MSSSMRSGKRQFLAFQSAVTALFKTCDALATLDEGVGLASRLVGEAHDGRLILEGFDQGVEALGDRGAQRAALIGGSIHLDPHHVMDGGAEVKLADLAGAVRRTSSALSVVSR